MTSSPFCRPPLLQVLVLVLFLVLLVIGIVGSVKVKDGLEVTDVVPKDTAEYDFLSAQARYFGFYNFFAVTKVSG